MAFKDLSRNVQEGSLLAVFGIAFLGLLTVLTARGCDNEREQHAQEAAIDLAKINSRTTLMQACMSAGNSVLECEKL